MPKNLTLPYAIHPVDSKKIANIKKIFLLKNQKITHKNHTKNTPFYRSTSPPYDPNQIFPYTALLVSHCVVLTLKSES
ncbi:hypothetical protein [Serratia sp. HMSC15F11]|uniref:hypothetical protein n=1 Tax=Serratia sp. HMSC15F11 TaxID=1581106 RepID=UPI0011130E7E|nr:hypothetical protein [Serratia sp. HMSC15F11]